MGYDIVIYGRTKVSKRTTISVPIVLYNALRSLAELHKKFFKPASNAVWHTMPVIATQEGRPFANISLYVSKGSYRLIKRHIRAVDYRRYGTTYSRQKRLDPKTTSCAMYHKDGTAEDTYMLDGVSNPTFVSMLAFAEEDVANGLGNTPIVRHDNDIQDLTDSDDDEVDAEILKEAEECIDGM